MPFCCCNGRLAYSSTRRNPGCSFGTKAPLITRNPIIIQSQKPEASHQLQSPSNPKPEASLLVSCSFFNVNTNLPKWRIRIQNTTRQVHVVILRVQVAGLHLSFHEVGCGLCGFSQGEWTITSAPKCGGHTRAPSFPALGPAWGNGGTSNRELPNPAMYFAVCCFNYLDLPLASFLDLLSSFFFFFAAASSSNALFSFT